VLLFELRAVRLEELIATAPRLPVRARCGACVRAGDKRVR
jgi:hypothetical protein